MQWQGILRTGFREDANPMERTLEVMLGPTSDHVLVDVGDGRALHTHPRAFGGADIDDITRMAIS